MCAGNLALKFCNFANLAGLDPAEEEAIAIWRMEICEYKTAGEVGNYF